MWLFTETGFISAVQHRNEPGKTIVRARDRASLELLADMSGTAILFTPVADYCYRTVVTKEDLQQYMLTSIDEMQYDNFKSRVIHTRGRRFVHALHKVWEIMHDVEDTQAKTRYRMSREEEELAYESMEQQTI